MCTDCGCSITDSVVAHGYGEVEHTHSHEHHKAHEHLHHNPQLNDKKTIDVITMILAKNDHEAGHNRSHFDKPLEMQTALKPKAYLRFRYKLGLPVILMLLWCIKGYMLCHLPRWMYAS